jgi:alkanesulfonate monooxygenase SsuD/methylene tetrahydromethanopterin reductase-like flavin-dependent oxidoreductase (luciferase family)
LKFGLSVGTVGSFAEARAHAEVAAAAEAGGWDGYFVWDGTAHPYRPVVDPWVALAVIAGATSRITIGPMVAAVPNYTPAQLEALAGSIHDLAPGRFILGAGLGDAPGSLAGDRVPKLEAGLTAVRSAHPGVPVWLGASDPIKRPAAVRRAASWDGLFPTGMDRPVTEVRTIARAIAPARDLAIGVTSLLGFDAQRLSAYEDAGATWLIETILPWQVTPEIAVARVGKVLG